jgi:hypothetical protein
MKLNKQVKILRFGHCYINRAGDFAITLLRGGKMGWYKNYYTFAASHANPAVFLGEIQLSSRTVPNDGNWVEISVDMFKIASACHTTGHVIKVPEVTGLKTPLISRMYSK